MDGSECNEEPHSDGELVSGSQGRERALKGH